MKEVNRVYIKKNEINIQEKIDNINTRRCDISKIIIHRAIYAKHLRSTKPLENETHFEMNIP